MVLDGQWTLLSSGSLNVGLNSATSYGSFIISSNYPSIVGNAGLAGAFNATLNNGYVPTNGTTFNVIVLWLIYGKFQQPRTSGGLTLAVQLWQHEFHTGRRERVAAVWSLQLIWNQSRLQWNGRFAGQQLRGVGEHQPDHPIDELAGADHQHL